MVSSCVRRATIQVVAWDPSRSSKRPGVSVPARTKFEQPKRLLGEPSPQVSADAVARTLRVPPKDNHLSPA